MSRLYDTVEPSVIDEEALQKAIEDQGPKEEAGRIAKQEGIDFHDVRALRLDFKNILKIDNMWSFRSLTKLQLDNNIIEKIEGLNTLVNLVWLDLSFNNIEVIEGLDCLTKLEDLTLYNNRIKVIENMDALARLHVFSIGNNDLQELDNLVYLRKYKHLRTLNLSGNPFCEQEDYRLFVIAYLPKLDFLDYRLIDQTTKDAAFDRHHLVIEELMHNEEVAQNKINEQQTRQAELERHEAAYVEHLDTPHLFESLYAEDQEGQKINHMPGVDDLLLRYREKFCEISKKVFDFGLEEHGKRVTEVDEFFASVDEAKKENKETGQKSIDGFLVYKKKLFLELPQITDQKVLENRMADYNKEVTSIWDKLMGYELALVDQLEETIQNFERNLSDMVTNFVEFCQGLISQMRDLESIHHEKLLEIAITTLEKVVKNELDDEIPEDLRLLFVDKDTIINAVSTSHDIHQLKIDQQEDDINQRINQWMSNLMEEIHQKQEVTRNRVRVSEINNLIDHLRDEVDTLDLHLE